MYWPIDLPNAGVQGRVFVDELPADLSTYTNIWLNFDLARLNAGDWRRWKAQLLQFAANGGCVILDNATSELSELPIPLQNGKGFAGNENGYASDNARLPGDQLAITYGFIDAPNHPLLQGMTEKKLSLWGSDYYLAHRCLDIPQDDKAIPLVVAGCDERDNGKGGLNSTALLELRTGKGCFLVSTLELMPKLLEEPVAANWSRRWQPITRSTCRK